MVQIRKAAQIRERRRVGLIRILDVVDQTGCTIRREVFVDERVSRSGDCPQLDGDDVVGHTPPVGEAGSIASHQPEKLWRFGWSYGHVDSQHVCRRRAGEVLETFDY